MSNARTAEGTFRLGLPGSTEILFVPARLACFLAAELGLSLSRPPVELPEMSVFLL